MPRMRLRGSCAEAVEPALELCMKIQRSPALTVNESDVLGHQLGWYRRFFGPLQGLRRQVLFLFNREMLLDFFNKIEEDVTWQRKN